MAFDRFAAVPLGLSLSPERPPRGLHRHRDRREDDGREAGRIRRPQPGGEQTGSRGSQRPAPCVQRVDRDAQPGGTEQRLPLQCAGQAHCHQKQEGQPSASCPFHETGSLRRHHLSPTNSGMVKTSLSLGGLSDDGPAKAAIPSVLGSARDRSASVVGAGAEACGVAVSGAGPGLNIEH